MQITFSITVLKNTNHLQRMYNKLFEITTLNALFMNVLQTFNQW